MEMRAFLCHNISIYDMGFFKKKKELGSDARAQYSKEKELSSLPALPEMPLFPELPSEPKSLPQFSQFTVPQLPSELEPARITSRPMVMEIGEEKKTAEIARIKEQPIFVKIEKYREAVMNLEMIKKKLQETSNLLEKIKETRAKEEEELNIWTEEINAIKEKIEVIDKRLFSGI